MDVYIEREALIHNLKKFALEQLTPLIESLIQKQPSADVVEVRHGRWIEEHEFFKCSKCGCLTDYRLSNFCPDCGAKMDGKDGNNND